MNLFDDIIAEIEKLSVPVASHSHTFCHGSSWKEGTENQMIFRNETALELGEGSHCGLSGILFTSNRDFVEKDEVILIGKEMKECSPEGSYARLVYILTDDENLGQGNALYSSLRKIDYTRYHLNPEGMMIRISPLNFKESIRVSKKALKDGISFEKVGNAMIEAYHAQKGVCAVKIVFINADDYDYSSLSRYLQKNEDIIKALDHLLNKVKMDCHSCSLQKVCAEVEKKVTQDFGKEQNLSK